MKRILVTGASGYLGSNLIAKLLDRGDTEVIAILGRPEDKANQIPQGKSIIIYPYSELFTTDFGHVDTLIHTAFSRGDNLLGLTTSIELTKNVIELVNNQDIDSLLNISTQGLYQGLKPGEKVTEDGVVNPNTAYGLAKWAVENMLNVGCKKKFTNIRMASLSANARFLNFFIDSIIAHRDIKIIAPRQYASIMDISDAVMGILSVERIPIPERDNVYNLGAGEQYSILEYANMVNEIGILFGFSPVQVSVDDNGSAFAICMDCRKLQSKTSWSPIVGKELMITKLFDAKTNGEIS